MEGAGSFAQFPSRATPTIANRSLTLFDNGDRGEISNGSIGECAERRWDGGKVALWEVRLGWMELSRGRVAVCDTPARIKPGEGKARKDTDRQRMDTVEGGRGEAAWGWEARKGQGLAWGGHGQVGRDERKLDWHPLSFGEDRQGGAARSHPARAARDVNIPIRPAASPNAPIKHTAGRVNSMLV